MNFSCGSCPTAIFVKHKQDYRARQKKKLIATVADTGGKYIKNSASNSHKTSVENRDITVAQTIGSCEARTCKRSEFFKEDPTLKKTVDG